MRTIRAAEISGAVAENVHYSSLRSSGGCRTGDCSRSIDEESEVGREILDRVIENIGLSRSESRRYARTQASRFSSLKKAAMSWLRVAFSLMQSMTASGRI